MKKSFTLIELMVSLIAGLVLINFAFTYHFNFFKEIKLMKANDQLAMHSFKLSELIARGFKNGSDKTKGLICLTKFIDDKNIETGFLTYMHVNNELLNGKHTAKIDDYYYTSVVSQNIKIHKVKDKNGNIAGTNDDKPWIYAIHINVKYQPEIQNSFISDPFYFNYTRLVYTK